MPVPAIGNVVTPSGLTATSAQGQVILSWNSVPHTGTYYINRSVDNVTFTNIATNTLNNTAYSDTTGVVNTVYYYNVQAGNGTSSSPASASVASQSLTPGQTTLGNLILECQQRTDRVNADNISNQEWTSMISQSYKWLYNLLIQKFGDDYFVANPVSYLTTGIIDPTFGAQVFPLPVDFFKMLRVEVALNPGDPNSWVTLRQFMAIDANKYNYPNVYTYWGVTNLRWRLWGRYLQLVPISSAGQTIRIWYAPRPNQLINSYDIVDGISAFEELLVVDTCIKALAKTEEDTSVFILQYKNLLQQVEEAAENRSIGEPQVVSDARTRNMAWSDDTGGYGGSW